LLISVAVTEVTGAGVGATTGKLAVGEGAGADVGSATGTATGVFDTHVAVSVMVPPTHRVLPDTTKPLSQPAMQTLPE